MRFCNSSYYTLMSPENRSEETEMLKHDIKQAVPWLGIPAALIAFAALTYCGRDQVEKALMVMQTRNDAQEQAHAFAEAEKAQMRKLRPGSKFEPEGPCEVRKINRWGGEIPYFDAKKIQYQCGNILAFCRREGWREEYKCGIHPMYLIRKKPKKVTSGGGSGSSR